LMAESQLQRFDSAINAAAGDLSSRAWALARLAPRRSSQHGQTSRRPRLREEP
jgi:hypothetical protein